ncbi:hypothetical protein [Arthrobacter sp. H16F315]|uniref:hypothetical protein n=1 Tax=Arthrobacter sp. H16F315 TaxID=2955314 RepID=UPI0020973020|nr:hypothetical protein [Arthrobacter sp. H16F315]MDD1478482.1 hypothetical protein [Arthrobacter sp. H16F315]
MNSFNTPPDWKPKFNPDGTPAPPPGAGKILLKVPGRAGIPVKMTLTDIEKKHHVTDERSKRFVPTEVQDAEMEGAAA